VETLGGAVAGLRSSIERARFPDFMSNVSDARHNCVLWRTIVGFALGSDG